MKVTVPYDFLRRKRSYFLDFSLESHYPKPIFCYLNFRPDFRYPNFKQGVIQLSQIFPCYPVIPNFPFRALLYLRIARGALTPEKYG